MAASSKANSVAASKPTPIVVGALLAVLVLIVGWLAYANFLAPPKAAPMTAQARSDHEYLKQLALKSGGDPSKLSVDERNKLDAMTHGFGAMALQTILKEDKK